MVEWIVSSSVLVAVVILLRFVLKGKISLRLQYALWAVVLVRLLVPVSFGDTAMSVSNLTQKAAETEPVQFVSALSETELPRMSYQAAYNEVSKEYADRGINIEEMPLEEYAETVDYEIMNKMNGDLSVAEVVKIIWISGITLAGIWFLLSNLRLYRSLKKTRTLLTDSHALPVYLSDAIDTPCLFGLFHPAIYLTSEAIESEHTQRHAVEHELTHFHHKDNIWAILRSVCLAVHWFNPLVWCAAVLSRNDAELACDESTILRLGEDERAAYGRTLIHLTCEKRPALLNTATTMTGSGKSIKERIALIVKKPKMALYTLIAVVVIVAAVVGCTFTGAKKTNTPWNWAQNLTSEDISSVELWSDRGNVSLTDGEHADFVRILNALEKKDFTENGQLTGGTPTYGLTVQTSDGEYHISESIAPSGSLEMGYGDKQWWIDNDALTAFIRTLLEQSAIPTGQYVSVEEYIVQQAEGEDTVSLMMWEIPSTELSDEEYEATVVDRKLRFLKQYGSLDGLSPNGTLEAWGYEWLIKPDTSEINPEYIVLAGGQYMDEDGYICFTNGQIVVALHYPDDSYDVLGEEPYGDGIDFFGYHNSTEESIYDWYVKKYNLDLPLYVEDWIDLIAVPEGGSLGNFPVHRFDGDGWYIYVPVDTWTTPVRNSAGNYEITSEYQTGSSIIISKSSDSDEQVLAGCLDMGYEITEAGAVRRDGVETDCVYIYPTDDGGSHVVHTIWYDENITDYPYIAMEPDVMRLIAESFTVDARIGHASENTGEELAMVQALQAATMDNSALTRIEGNVEAGVTRSGTTMEVFKSAAENLRIMSDPLEFDSYAGGTYLWLGEPGDRHISFFAGKEPYQVKLRYVGDDINESAVTNNPQLYLFLMAAKEMENVELHDLDGDGLLEGVIWPVLPNDHSIVIYDIYDGALQRIDVNEAMNCKVSGFTGLIANINPDYNKMIQIANGDGGGDVYAYRDGVFSYVCPLNDVIGYAPPHIEDTAPVVIFNNDEITITAPEKYADLIKVDDVGSDNMFTIAANLYYAPEYTANDNYAPMTNGGWMMSVQTTSYTSAISLYSNQEPGWTVHRWTGDGRWVYAEHRVLPGEYKCSSENLAEFQAVMDSIEVSYEGLVPFDGERAIAQMNVGSPIDNTPFVNQPISWDTPLNGMFERTYETQLSMLGNIDQTTPPFFKSQTFEFDTCTVLLGTSLDLETTTHVGTIYILFHSGALGKLPLPLNSNGVAMLPPAVVDAGNNTITYDVSTGISTYHYTVDLVAQTVSMTVS